MTSLSAMRTRLLPLLLLALAPGLSGCTLALPMTALVSDAGQARGERGQTYSVERPPPEGTPVVLVLDDGSEAAGRWRGRGPGERVLLAHADSLHAVDVARIVQVRTDGTRGGSGAGRAFVVGLLIDGVIVLRLLGQI